MRIISAALCGPLLALVLIGCGGGGGSSGAAPAPAPPASGGGGNTSPGSLQDTVDRAVARGVDGAILTVLAADGTLTTRTAGVRQRGLATPMEADDIFKMASVSKLYIAVAVVQLVDGGMLGLDDSIAQHLPAIGARIANASAITVRMLLRHRSGVPDFDSQQGFTWAASHPDVDQVLEYALDLPADFPPDAREEYSNTNYLLLAKIMDVVLGYSHHQQIQDFILNPLGLTDTFHLPGQADDARVIHGYWDGRDTREFTYVVPGGSMYGTGADIATFVDALGRGTLLNAEAQQTYRSVYWLGHTGWLPGYQTYARWEGALDAAVVLHINNTGGLSETIIEDTYNDVLDVLANR